MEFSQKINRIVEYIYPLRCVLCGLPGHNNMDICKRCYSALPVNKFSCCVCAFPLPINTHENIVCGQCLKKSPSFDNSISVFHYSQTVVWLIQQLKFNDSLSVSRLLAQLFTDRIKKNITIKPDCIIPVPLHRKRLAKRGFNQSIEISRLLSKELLIPLELKKIQRIKYTSAQTGLDAKQRRKNIKSAFKVGNSFKADYVAIVDDVVTTGSTVNELAKELKKSGVKRVDVWSMARA